MFVGVLAGAPAAVAGQQGLATMQPAAQSDCPNAPTHGIWSTNCLPSVDVPPEHVDLRGPNQLPTLDGIPCSPGECIGRAQTLP
ncbi:hypothetical protein AU187_18595 [Mycobacterium sp. IS-1556]|nr:hypothetical protein AU187_18595 [Mycobacterium sp. IS-1556]KUH88217.1 hypothetical protein AU185_17815 [Mycobacterium sp. GA-0227b]